MYDITNEMPAIEQALIDLDEIKVELINMIEIEIKKSWGYRIDNFFTKIFKKEELLPLKYMTDNSSSIQSIKWHCMFRINGFSYNQILNAQRDLQNWREAILRGNDFRITEAKYKDFLAYIRIFDNIPKNK